MSEQNKTTTCASDAGVRPADPQPQPECQAARTPMSHTTAFGCPRDFLENRFIYLTVSPRARGLSVGVNLNPDKFCNFDCVYCEVDRRQAAPKAALDLEVMSDELERTLSFVCSGDIRRHPSYSALPDELRTLRHVALSGDGEPTLCPNFAEAMQTVVHARARGTFPFFKIVLITNATGLDQPGVAQSLKLLTEADEVWAKLDAGTQAFMDKVNHPTVALDKVLANILALARQRPVIIQGMFSMLNGQEPPDEEIEQYVRRLNELKSAGATISLVQVYSPTRPMPLAICEHLPLKSLSRIAKSIRTGAGLRAEVF